MQTADVRECNTVKVTRKFLQGAARRWRKLREKVEAARDEVLELMKKHKLTVYQFDNKEVSVTEKEVVKVKKKKPDNGDD